MMSTQISARYQKGQVIGARYQIHQVKFGGMSEVYLCYDLEKQLPRALKTVQSRFESNPRLRELLKREVRTWIALEKHPNIVQCSHLDQLDGLPFLVLEWIAGDPRFDVDLRSWLRQGALDLRLALDFCIDICRGLMHADQMQPGIVHRDIKPENILVAEGALAKITDFGLAAVVQQADLRLSEDGSLSEIHKSLVGKDGMIGTPTYMAPEQWRGHDLDCRTDVYAIGCVLYEMITGHAPFISSTLVSLRRQHFTQPVPRLRNGGNATPKIETIIGRCMAKNHNERFVVADLYKALVLLYTEEFHIAPRMVDNSAQLSAVEYNNRGITYNILGLQDHALADFNQAIALDGSFEQAINNRGIMNLQSGRQAEALADFDEAIRLNPELPHPYTNRATLYNDQGLHDAALADFDKALELGQKSGAYSVNSVTHLNRSLLYAAHGLYETAIQDVTEAILANPYDPKNYLTRSQFYRRLEHPEDALRDLDDAVRLDPGNVAAYMERSLAYESLNNYVRALQDIDLAISLETFPTAQSACKLLRATYYMGLGRFSEAVEDITQGIQSLGANARLYAARSTSYSEMGEFEKALNDAILAVELQPDLAVHYNRRGVLYYELGIYDKALTDFSRAIELDQTFAEAYFNTGLIFRARRSHYEALQCFQKSTELGYALGAEYIAQVQRELEV